MSCSHVFRLLPRHRSHLNTVHTHSAGTLCPGRTLCMGRTLLKLWLFVLLILSFPLLHISMSHPTKLKILSQIDFIFSWNLWQANGGALPQIDNDETDIYCSSADQSNPNFWRQNVAAQPKYARIRTGVLRVLTKPNRASRTNTCCNFDKCICLFGQIQFVVCRNTFLCQEWRVPAAECANQTVQAELHRILSCLCQQLIWQLLGDFFSRLFLAQLGILQFCIVMMGIFLKTDNTF